MKNKSFSECVYEVVKKIPQGKVSTYSEIGKSLKSKAYRAIGTALNKNPYKDVYCFKIIKNTGEVGGYALGKKEKIKKLKADGVVVRNGKVNLEKYLYSFSKRK